MDHTKYLNKHSFFM